MQREHGKRKRAHNASMHRKRMHRRYTQREHGRRKRDNASMHSASTKHGPAQPHDVDDFDERSAHDVDERLHADGVYNYLFPLIPVASVILLVLITYPLHQSYYRVL